MGIFGGDCVDMANGYYISWTSMRSEPICWRNCSWGCQVSSCLLQTTYFRIGALLDGSTQLGCHSVSGNRGSPSRN